MSIQIHKSQNIELPNSRSTFLAIVLAILFASLLSIPFLDHDYYYLSWIAFVPLLFAIERASLSKVYCISLIAGFFLFVLGTFWIKGYAINAKGLSGSMSLFLSAVMWFFSAQVIACSMLMFKYLSRATRVHEFILFPVIISFSLAVFPALFTLHLGESQVNNLYALQAIEFFGVYGLDAIIALANILVFRFMYNFANGKSVFFGANKSSWFLAIGILLVWFFYGITSYHSLTEKISSWQSIKLGLVQPNENSTLGNSVRYPKYSKAYPPEMEMTARLSELGAELIIWPEAQTKNYFNNSKVKSAYSSSISKIQTSLLFQDKEKISENEYSVRLSSMAVLLNKEGIEQGTYQKIKRIPFGEYLPIVEKSTYLQSKVQKWLDKSNNELIPGEQHQLFTHASVNIIPLICYETTSPSFVANAVKSTTEFADKENGTILVGLSNDGWFKSLVQTKLHVFPSSLRAVENRLPLVHVVNNGPSIVVSPTGKRVFTSNYGQAGGYIVDVPYSENSGGSFYSAHPRVFLYLLYMVFFLILASVFWNKLRYKSHS